MFCYIMWLVPPYHFVTGMTAKYVWFKLNCLTRHTVISLLSKLLLHFLCNLNDIWRLWLTWRVISQNTFSVPSYSRISFLLQLGRHFTYALSKIILQGTVEGGRKRGRQRKSWSDNVKEWTSLDMGHLLQQTTDRQAWRRVSVSSSTDSPRRWYLVKGWVSESEFTYAIFVKFLCVRPRFHAQFYKKKDNNCIWSNNISVVIAKGHSYVMHGPTGQKDERCVTTLRLHIYQVS